MIIVTVHDTVADYFLPPFFARNGGQACRMFIASIGDSFPHRGDFNLYQIGSFSEDTGEIESMDPSMILAGNSIGETFDPRIPPSINQNSTQELQS